jgi:YVTN family beta-propeller protein
MAFFSWVALNFERPIASGGLRMRKFFSKRKVRLIIAGLWIAASFLAVLYKAEDGNSVRAFASSSPSYSSPIVLNNGNRFVWVVNPDNNSVTRIDIGNEPNFSTITIPVGREPQSLVLAADDSKVYVANTVDGTVSVISTANNQVVKTIPVGTEPRAVALSPSGNKLYVANASSNNISVIDTKSDRVVKTITGVGTNPYALAITNNGDFNDNDERVLVTNFLAQYRPGSIRPGFDDGKVGQVFVISVGTDAVDGIITLDPVQDTGFRSNGSALKRIPAGPANNPNLVTTGAFPNILNSIVIKGNRAYVPATGSSPDGPVLFNVNVQSLLTVIDLQANRDANLTTNMNFGINFEPDKFDPQGNPLTRFVTVPYAIAFKKGENTGYMVSALSDMIVKVDLDPNTGKGTINAPKAANDPGNIVRILVGKNPRGIVIRDDDTRAYVMNYVSRDVSVVDIVNNRVIGTVTTAPQPADAFGKTVQRGKELFNTSIGPIFEGQAANFKGQGRMSNHGWGGCFECHPNGLTDGVVWMFADGPRRAIPLNWDFDKKNQNIERLYNFSAARDEVQDFELNTRGVSGGAGLIRLANGDPDPAVTDLLPLANSGRNLDQDAISVYVSTIRSPISPISQDDQDVKKGRKIFEKAGCINCHSGSLWSSSVREFNLPVTSDKVKDGQIATVLKKVGTFDPNKPHEIRGTGAAIGQVSRGTDGYSPASLLGVAANGPYLHDGSALTIEDVLTNPSHVGTSPLLSNGKKRQQLIKFVLSIDDRTEPFPLKK